MQELGSDRWASGIVHDVPFRSRSGSKLSKSDQSRSLRGRVQVAISLVSDARIAFRVAILVSRSASLFWAICRAAPTGRRAPCSSPVFSSLAVSF